MISKTLVYFGFLSLFACAPPLQLVWRRYCSS